MNAKPSVVAVLGPTACGKTSVGCLLAGRFDGEIVSCDSMQIYRGLPIGTAQPSAEELAAAPHHLISFLELTQPFSVSDYVSVAAEAIQEINARGKLPLVVGGTGLYARSLLRGFSFAESARDEELRWELLREAEEQGSCALYQELAAADPAAAEEIHPNNVKRVLRALEYIRLTGEPFSAQAKRSQTAQAPYRTLTLVLGFRDREKLYRRIDSRVDAMLEAGLLDEAEGFYRFCREQGAPPTAAQAIGYKELFPYFAGELPLEKAVENVKRESRRYAKRQITWFARERDAVPLYWDDHDEPQELEEACLTLVKEFLEGEERR